MQRIATATKAVDLYGVGKHGFRDGNLALGITPTDFEAAWANGVQEELVSVIEAAGLVPSGATLTQLLTALRSAGVHTTAAQFDNTTMAATTAFVKRFGLQFSSQTFITANTTLTAAHLGSVVEISSASPVALALPATSVAPGGGAIWFFNDGSGDVTLNRAGADTIVPSYAAALTSIVLKPGDNLLLVTNSSTKWLAVGGSAQLQYAPGFGSSIAASGYKKIPDANSPSGFLIFQWGIWTASATPGAAVAISFPTSFPTARRILVPSVINSSTTVSSAWFDTPTSSGFNGRANIAGLGCEYFAIGN